MTAYPQVNFNPYNMYQNWGYGYQYPAFRGVQNVPQPVSVPQPNVNLQTPPDTVSFKATEHTQTKPKKEGLSIGAKWGLGALALAGIGTAVYFATRGKVGAKQAQQLAEHIEFKPAKTVEEAKKFAKKNLGLEWSGELKEKDLELINYVNDWVCRGYNAKKFNIVKPDVAGSLEGTGVDGLFAALKDGNKNLIGIKTDKIIQLGDQLVNYDFTKSSIYCLDNNNLITIKNAAYDVSFVKDFVNKWNQYRKNPNSYSVMDKLKLLTDWKIVDSSPIVNGKLNPRKMTIDNWLNHENGHLLHMTTEKNFSQMGKVSEYINRPVSNITKEFVENDDIQKIARSVTKYAKKSPAEFVAEVYAGMCDGIKFSDDVMALYKKYGGPALK